MATEHDDSITVHEIMDIPASFVARRISGITAETKGTISDWLTCGARAPRQRNLYTLLLGLAVIIPSLRVVYTCHDHTIMTNQKRGDSG